MFIIGYTMGRKLPLAAFVKIDNGEPVWGTFSDAQTFEDESLAQSVIDANELQHTIIMSMGGGDGE